MQDQHFLQGWDRDHIRLAAARGPGLARRGATLGSRTRHRSGIGDTYGKRAGAPVSKRGRAGLHGLAATGATVLLWVVVLALATPAPGLAASVGAAETSCHAGQPALA